MQYRLYTDVDKNLFCDPSKILVGVRDFLELGGNIDEKSFAKIKACYPYAVAEESVSAQKDTKKAVLYMRSDRGDKNISEANSVIELVKSKGGITAKMGRVFYFSDETNGEAAASFLENNVNPYVYSDKYITVPQEDGIKSEKLNIQSFCQAQYDELMSLKNEIGLSMAIDDLMCVQNYFISESREPSYTELKIIDGFFSENFRHTTFETILDSVKSESPEVSKAWEHYLELSGSNSPSLSDITITASSVLPANNVVKASKKLAGIKVESSDENDSYIVISKNESHNRSVTAVPYDGAAGAIGGAVKDIYCALGYAYDSYRVIGRGKTELSRKKAISASAGYAETASQIGVPCSKCKETLSSLYNEKQLEVCSVLAVADANGNEKLVSKEPTVGDKVYLVGGKTGADGLNSSHHSLKASDSFGEYIPVTDCGELSCLQRLFVRSDFADIAVAINDVGSGGMVCALGEIVDGAEINVSSVKLKHGELSCADIVLSESNERMIVCVRESNASVLESICKDEGIDCSCVATVTDDGCFTVYDEDGKRFVFLPREFLISGGAEKHLNAYVAKPGEIPVSEALAAAKAPMTRKKQKNVLSGKPGYDYQRGYILSAGEMSSVKAELSHTFDKSAGGSTSDLATGMASNDYSLRELRYCGRRIMGKNGKPLCSVMSCATLPEISKLDPYKGAYLSVCDAVIKLVAAGCAEEDIYLSLQEYFPEHKNSSVRLGVSVASMLGVFEAQMQLGIVSIGGRISIGSGVKDYETASSVTAFAFCVSTEDKVKSSSFTEAGSKILLLRPECDEDEICPDGQAITELINDVSALYGGGYVRSGASLNAKNVCTGLMEMCRCGEKGVEISSDCSVETLFADKYCCVLLEVAPDAPVPKNAEIIGYVSDDFAFIGNGERFNLSGALGAGERPIPKTEHKEYLCRQYLPELYGKVKPLSGVKVNVLMPVTAFTVSQNEIREEFLRMGATVTVRNVSDSSIGGFIRALRKADVLWLSDTLGRTAFTTALLSDKRVRCEIDALIERGGLIYGNGTSFEALLQSGVMGLDTGKIGFSHTAGELTSYAVDIKSVSPFSPFMRYSEPGRMYKGYVSGKRLKLFVMPDYADELAEKGLIASQFSADTNAVGSTFGINAICSENGQVYGEISRTLLTKDALPLIRSALGYFSSYGTGEGDE